MTRVNVDPGDISEERLRHILGNASLETKGVVQRWLSLFATYGFGARSARCLDLIEVSILPNSGEPLAPREARVVLETTVTQDMLNATGEAMHQGCIAHFVDMCTTLPISVMWFARSGEVSAGVSQNINIIYHALASLGDRLRLINTTTTIGTDAWNARIEIWDVTHHHNHRLVASATQVKMEASPSKL